MSREYRKGWSPEGKLREDLIERIEGYIGEGEVPWSVVPTADMQSILAALTNPHMLRDQSVKVVKMITVDPKEYDEP